MRGERKPDHTWRCGPACEGGEYGAAYTLRVHNSFGACGGRKALERSRVPGSHACIHQTVLKTSLEMSWRIWDRSVRESEVSMSLPTRGIHEMRPR